MEGGRGEGTLETRARGTRGGRKDREGGMGGGGGGGGWRDGGREKVEMGEEGRDTFKAMCTL